ncbi:uncharacterized protein LOC121382209 [Gigantopelta aegis]|uniref:uncharacterized protein LOC121382209 n=1 Tax=Gigantopelta aegis TaxID=1735272 RepID=UPI001B88B731|nr:uncharacterized protein LOC121382209 [Gigantopelta aegis]
MELLSLSISNLGCYRLFIWTLILMHLCLQDGLSIQEVNATSIKKVHLIFMNHLDVGFADGYSHKLGFVNNVLNKYFSEFFPRAADISQELRKGQYVETMVYTTHPWLVSLYINCPPNLTLAGIKLKCPKRTEVKRFEAAVHRGDITWHAGPMNMQFEMIDTSLVEMAIQLGLDLDKHFGIQRSYRTLSQRDVPGMSQALLPVFAKLGVAAVSVGVNGATAPPAVPKIFHWKFQNVSLIGMWTPWGYPNNPGSDPAHPEGLSKENCITFPGLTHALCFAFRTDNTGPPESVQEVLSYYEILRVQFPNAKLEASTFEKFVAAAQAVKSQLPVVTTEIGDTWIQGAGSDPRKVAAMRAFFRARSACLKTGSCNMADPAFYNASRFLLKLGEHTCGLSNVYDTVNYTNDKFRPLLRKKAKNLMAAVSSWIEQREFLSLALDALGDLPLAKEVQQAWKELEASPPDLSDYQLVTNPRSIQSCSSGFLFGFSRDGSINTLKDPITGINWASKNNKLGQFVYQTYNQTDFDTFFKEYQTGAFFLGIGKPNMTNNSVAESKIWETSLVELYKAKGDKCSFQVYLKMTDTVTNKYYGAPLDVWVTYTTTEKQRPPGLSVTLQWFNKYPTRLPEALLFVFQPVIQDGYHWQLHKLGQLINPLNVVLNGSQRQHAVDKGVYYKKKDNSQGLEILSLDAAVVTLTTSRDGISTIPLPLTPIADVTGAAFQLYNNIWDVNFIFWYPYLAQDSNQKFRFQINFLNYSK